MAKYTIELRKIIEYEGRETVEGFFKDYCLNNLWGTCIYQLQLGNLKLDKEDRKALYAYVKNVTSKKTISLKDVSVKEKIWLIMAKISLPFTCWVRNKLGIGL